MAAHHLRLKESDLLTGIAPVFRIDRKDNEVKLVGTGFWVTEFGHLITAWHVVDENIDEDGIDAGPIFAIQTFSDHSVAVRTFKSTDKHPVFDMALSETTLAPEQRSSPTAPLMLSLDDLAVGDAVFSFAVLAPEQTFDNEKNPGATLHQFHGEICCEYLAQPTPLTFAVRLSFGSVFHIFETMRDRIMLPFPCIQSDVPIYGGNSGGPLLDMRGRICAIHCTSFGGNDIAFHVPLWGALALRMRAHSIGIDGVAPSYRTIGELALQQKVRFDPPVLDVRRPMRSLFRWISYVIKSLLQGKRPSMVINFVLLK